MEDVRKEILNSSNSLKRPLDIYLPYLTKSINDTINEGKFPSELKHLGVMILFKKEDPLMKENYRQILPHLLKVFERAIYK